jgi:hypothetical protein
VEQILCIPRLLAVGLSKFEPNRLNVLTVSKPSAPLLKGTPAQRGDIRGAALRGAERRREDIHAARRNESDSTIASAVCDHHEKKTALGLMSARA